ncbi:hypothetical protein, partial [Kitasatospora sp. NPDC056181]|uniref:hypothetical protein n=1 Tax=Kitasatospora sp. NPDC056181 TaxID=3345737 RepID=UPI0035DBA372
RRSTPRIDETGRRRGRLTPHPPAGSLVGPYVYSYDVSASHRRSTTVPRAIPGMRPSYDAEHPHSTTPIYDELYSEYRRLFRALPGDRSGEENLRFTGFAVRDNGYPSLGEPRPFPPQHQAFQTYAGQALGIPQFMPNQQTGPGHTGHGTHGSQGTHSSHSSHSSHGVQSTHAGHASHNSASHTPANDAGSGSGSGSVGESAGHGHLAGPSSHSGHPAQAGDATSGALGTPGGHGAQGGQGTRSTQGGQPAQPAAQFTNGQGWVAAGYLGPVPHPMPATAPAPVTGTGTGPTAGPATGGRHRNLLSLPPGRSSDQH